MRKWSYLSQLASNEKNKGTFFSSTTYTMYGHHSIVGPILCWFWGVLDQTNIIFLSHFVRKTQPNSSKTIGKI